MSSGPARRKARDSEVACAVRERSLQQLQELSLLTGGFGNARRQAWTFLLGVDIPSISNLDTASTHSVPDYGLSGSWTQPSEPAVATGSREALSDSVCDNESFNTSSDHVNPPSHPDAHQVQLDTNRSFILYPAEKHSIDHRKSLQEGLHDIIIGVLEKRPKLRYFQGYHDIITVLFLTLPLEVVLPCAEKMSLHRLRDSMGSGLEPLVGQLRILKRLLRLIDPSYAEILERNSPLPYYALSNLLTLFSHDVPTLPLIQHVFDWVLCHEPIAVIWLAAAVILRRKNDVLALEREGDEAMGMMHAVLSTWPALSDDDEPPHSDVESQSIDSSSQAPLAELPADEVWGKELGENSSDWPDSAVEITGEITYKETPSAGGDAEDENSITLCDDTGSEERDANFARRSVTPDSLMDSWTADMHQALSSTLVSVDAPASESMSQKIQPVVERHHATEDGNEVRSEITSEAEKRPKEEPNSRSRSRSSSRSLPGEFKEKPLAPPPPLSELLLQASELLCRYPPSSPALCLARTFGPQSALSPCNPPATGMLSDLNDDEADACVGGDDVVLAPTQEEQEEEFGPPRKPRTAVRPTKEKDRPVVLARNMIGRRRIAVAGVVLLLGVAVALYGFGPGGKGPVRHVHKFTGRGDRWVAAWVGGLLGLGQRLRIGV